MNNFEEYYKIRKISEDLFSLIVRIKKLNNFEVETLVNLLEFTIKIGGLKMNKYEMLYDDKIEIGSHTLYRIRALKNFGTVKAGDIGGYIEKEENLSQKGNCWVYDNAKVRGNARVYGNALVYKNARVYGDAYVSGNAHICDNAKINKISDVLCISPIGSRNDVTTFFKTKDNNICVKCGCFTGTIDDFLEAVNKTHGKNKHAKSIQVSL